MLQMNSLPGEKKKNLTRKIWGDISKHLGLLKPNY